MKKNIKYDLVIAGAGPSGITTALTFKKYNPKAQILIFDKQKFPRYKIGEVILPGAFEILKKLDLLDLIIKSDFPRKMGAYYYWGKSKDKGFLLPSNRLEVHNGLYVDKSPEIHSYHVDRYSYDYKLLKEAKNRGIEIIEEANVGKTIFHNNDNIDYININGGKIKSKFYVDGSGIYNGIIPKQIKQFKNYNFSGDICYHGYLKGAKYIHEFKGLDNYLATTVGAYGNKCWFWYIPIDKDLVSVGIVFKTSYNKNFVENKNKQELILKIISSFSNVKKVIKNAKFIKYKGLNKVNIIKNWNGISGKLTGNNWLLVGDSAFFSDPILSAGVTMAHRTGFYAGILLNNYLKSDNVQFKNVLLDTYSSYCNDFYSQVRDIIKFWYDGMDKNFDINCLFDKGELSIKQFGIINKNFNKSSFLYIVNGLLQTLDSNGDELSGDYEQEDYEKLIKGITGFNIGISGKNINDSDIYKINLDYKIIDKLRIYKDKFIFIPYIIIYNEYKSSFFIGNDIKKIILLLDGKRNISYILNKVLISYNNFNHNIVKKDIMKMLLLGFIYKIN